MFLTHKSSESYKILFRWLKNLASNELNCAIKWTTITCDFESGLLPAIQETFPDLTIIGCWFHWTQAGLKKLSTLGLSMQYQNNTANFRSYVQRVWTLAFVPVNSVQAMFEILNDSYPINLFAGFAAQVQLFREYMTSTYLDSR